MCSSLQGNNRRLYLDKLRQAAAASGHTVAAAAAGSAGPSTPRYTPQQSKHEQLPIKHEDEEDDDDGEGEESKRMEESEHDSDE